jgi:hypothetical protein
MKIKMIIAANPNKMDRIARRIGKNKYKPTKAQTNPAPQIENPKTTTATFTTNFMLIGR